MVILGGQAEGLLLNPAFQEAVSQFRENLSTRFFASLPNDTAERERIYNLRLCLDAVIGNIQSFAMAKAQIELEQSTDE
jgi:hypothetical protein